jgi:hypothetical protein
MSEAKMEPVPFLPGRWLDFSDLNNICIREADGTIVATDLHVTKKDAEKLKRKYRAMMKSQS